LFDIAIRSGSTTLRRHKFPEKVALAQYGQRDVEYLKPEPHAREEREWAVLGFGTAWPAYIVLMDDCAIEKCRGREGRAPTDRVTLAPLRSRVPEDPADLGLLSTLNRFPLPADGEFDEDQVVLLAQAFQVDSRHIWADAGKLRLGFHLLRQVDDETRDSLLQRWAAHTARQGPLVGADNADKLAQLIKDIVDDEALADELADRLTVLSGCTWEYENGPLETISTAWEAWRTTSQMPDIDALITDLNAGLSRVQSAAQQVMGALEALRPRVPPDVTPP